MFDKLGESVVRLNLFMKFFVNFFLDLRSSLDFEAKGNISRCSCGQSRSSCFSRLLPLAFRSIVLPSLSRLCRVA